MENYYGHNKGTEMKTAKQILDDVCTRASGTPEEMTIIAMEEYATEVAKEALIEGARQASEYIYELKIDNSIMHHLIRRITDSKNIPTQ